MLRRVGVWRTLDERRRTIVRVLVVAGVSGSGKSTVGERLARRLGVPFVDGDDLHPAENVAKMRAGRPLDDADRAPWLAAIGAWVDEHGAAGAVVACSALRRSYRDELAAGRPELLFVYLDAARELIRTRLAEREDHFFKADLMDSQFAVLEPPAPDEHAVSISADLPIDDIVEHAVRASGAGPNGAARRPGGHTAG